MGSTIVTDCRVNQESHRTGTCTEMSWEGPGPHMVSHAGKSDGFRHRQGCIAELLLPKTLPTFLSLYLPGSNNNSYFTELPDVSNEQSSNKQIVLIHLD